MLKAGDILGFAGDGWLSVGITLATYGVPFWSLSHVGILADFGGRLLLCESTTLDNRPCEIRGVPCRGVQCQRVETRVRDYVGKVWHYPLCRELYAHESGRLSEFLGGQLGRPYDDLGAIRSGGVGLSWVESWLRDADLSSLFCSELCCAAHVRIGLLTSDNVSRWNPNRLVRHERNCGLLERPQRLK